MTLVFDNPVEVPRRFAVSENALLRRAAAPWIWGFAGFMLGALFWHLVGFWGFVSGVVYNARSDTPVVVQRRNEPIPAFTKSAPAARVAACVKLVRDRNGGTAVAQDCLTSDPALRNYGLARRGDRTVITRGWELTSR